jgi:hypothetical protein
MSSINPYIVIITSGVITFSLVFTDFLFNTCFDIFASYLSTMDTTNPISETVPNGDGMCPGESAPFLAVRA